MYQSSLFAAHVYNFFIRFCAKMSLTGCKSSAYCCKKQIKLLKMFRKVLFFNIRLLSQLLKSQFGSSFWCSSYIFGLQRRFVY